MPEWDVPLSASLYILRCSSVRNCPLRNFLPARRTIAAAGEFSAFCPAYNRLRDQRHAETNIMNLQRRQKLFGQQQRRVLRVEENFVYVAHHYYARYEKKKEKRKEEETKKFARILTKSTSRGRPKLLIN